MFLLLILLPQFHKLFDRISSKVMSPSRAPPGDGINRCRDAVDSIQSATSHKYSRDRAELVHLLGSPHIQVSDDF
jgi:calcium/calmodulin-dependent serine protein kinase